MGTILLVEDEDFVRNVTREILQTAGYRVIAAGDSATADRRCEEFGAPWIRMSALRGWRIEAGRRVRIA